MTLWLLAAVLTVSPAPVAHFQNPGEPCEAVLDGKLFPDLMPDHVAWLDLFDLTPSTDTNDARPALRQLAQSLNVDDAAIAVVNSIGAGAKARAAALRGGPAPRNAELADPRESAVADAVLEARDDLIRALPKEAFDQIENWVHSRRRQSTYAFVGLGRMTPPNDAGVRRCGVSVRGRERPHLIPQSYVWETYFRFLTGAARPPSGQDPEAYVREFIAAQRKTRLPIPVGDIQVLLTAATDIDTRVTARMALSGTPEVMRGDIREMVMEARASLIRQLPRSSWLAVARDAQNIARGTTFDFPTNW